MISFDTSGCRPNQEQLMAVPAAKNTPLFVVAGPETCDTSCLPMRMLRLISVVGMAPHGILTTTFTKKPTGEFRSCLLCWGYGLHEWPVVLMKLPTILTINLETDQFHELT
jgi:hypothetical protein